MDYTYEAVGEQLLHAVIVGRLARCHQVRPQEFAVLVVVPAPETVRGSPPAAADSVGQVLNGKRHACEFEINKLWSGSLG